MSRVLKSAISWLGHLASAVRVLIVSEVMGNGVIYFGKGAWN